MFLLYCCPHNIIQIHNSVKRDWQYILVSCRLYDLASNQGLHLLPMPVFQARVAHVLDDRERVGQHGDHDFETFHDRVGRHHPLHLHCKLRIPTPHTNQHISSHLTSSMYIYIYIYMSHILKYYKYTISIYNVNIFSTCYPTIHY